VYLTEKRRVGLLLDFVLKKRRRARKKESLVILPYMKIIGGCISPKESEGSIL